MSSKWLIEYCRKISRANLSIKDAILSDSLQISVFNRECPDRIRALVVKFVEGMMIYFGYTPENEKTVTDSQICMLANDICEKYYYYHLEDLCLCFKRARQNPLKYGKFYGRFDASVVMGWFSLYDKERDEVLLYLPPVKEEVKMSGEECSREEYREILEAMIAGGDLTANEKLLKLGDAERMMAALEGAFSEYKYYQKHRFDKKNDE